MTTANFPQEEESPAYLPSRRGQSQQKGTQPMITNNSQQLAEENLRLAADIEERTGWTVARLIAASVEPVTHGGDRRSDQVAAGNLKLGVKESARVLRKSVHTIKAYLAAWNAAAEDGLCKRSADLTPEDGWSAGLPSADWSEYYTNTKQRGVGVGQVRNRMRDDDEYATEVASNLPPAVTERVVREAIKSNPETQQIARKALDEVYTEQALNNRRNNPPREETQREEDQYDLAALVKVRKVKRDIGDLVGMVNNLGTGWDEALVGEIDWCINALQAIRSSMGGQSMDDALAALLNGEG